MSEIDKRLAEIKARVEGATPDDLGFFDGMAQAAMLANARADLGYLLDLVVDLRQRIESAMRSYTGDGNDDRWINDQGQTR